MFDVQHFSATSFLLRKRGRSKEGGTLNLELGTEAKHER